jgi:hypothetical protein
MKRKPRFAAPPFTPPSLGAHYFGPMDYGRPSCDPDEESPHFLPRRGQRLALREPTLMRGSGMAEMPVVIRDLSISGFRAECSGPVLIGSYVSVDLPGIGPVHAQIRWQVGGKIGGKFLDPVSLHRCAWTAPASE